MEVLEKEVPNGQMPEEKLTREQRRMRDRVNEDANKTFILLAEKFRECFMENDPESEEVTAKQKEVNAKWRVYCKNRNLIPDAYNQVFEYCSNLRIQYIAELHEVPPIILSNDNAPKEPEPNN